MIIKCDCCGREVSKEAAIPYEQAGQVFNFCSEVCRERGADLEAIEPSSPEARESMRGFVETGEDE